MGTLYLVATPIGNLEDVSLRALRVLREARLIAAEDTRVTRRLLDHYQIAARPISLNAANERRRRPALLAALADGDVALVSDAGTPTVSDPGADLVSAALEAGHAVVPIPGPSAVLAALAASGLGGGPFTFVGFLPRRGGERRGALARLVELPHPLVLFEAPTRLLATLGDLRAALGDRPAAVARELTKLHEEVVRGELGALVAHFEARPPRGEVTLVVGPAVHGKVSQVSQVSQLADADLDAALAEAVARGLRPRAAAAEVAQRAGRPARELYRRMVGRSGN
ncbi:MAG TPA: 16S rRNA (cytidine(1402)-2'-O)-methyltransferase [Chloroflexota bacterium]|jgi:16S rRNA (cytidine1402-2'-O)-methyltransferase